MALKVSDVLEHKGRGIVTAAPHETVASLVARLTENRIGAVPVIERDGRLAGIISERDVVHGLARHGAAVLDLPVEELMTREVRTCVPEQTLVELMEVMTLQRIRHLPVIRNGVLDGIVSIGDVVKQRLSEAQFELETLRGYITSAG